MSISLDLAMSIWTIKSDFLLDLYSFTICPVYVSKNLIVLSLLIVRINLEQGENNTVQIILFSTLSFLININLHWFNCSKFQSFTMP